LFQQVVNEFLALGRKHKRHQAGVVVQTTSAYLGLAFQSREIEEIVVIEFLFSSFDDESLEKLSQNVLVVKRQKGAFVF
jgi:hypothetical protein